MEKHTNKQLAVDEKKKLQALVAGKQAAFTYFYHKHRAQVYVNIRRMTKSHDLATELLQEVFVKVWQKRASIDVDRDFRAYLFVIAQHTVYDFFRQASRQEKLREQLIEANRTVNQPNNVDMAIAYKERLQLINEGIAQLPPKCRRVFELCKLEGKSYEEVANMLEISIATVNNHIVKATKHLRSHLGYSDVALLLAVLTASNSVY